jgi:hypothetical protein
LERHRALRSAWGVLAPSGLSPENQEITETGRALNDELKKFASQHPSSAEETAFGEIDARLDVLERKMRAIAFKVPVAQLRATLPAQVEFDRRRVLDLLDLMLGAEIEGVGGTEERIAAIDYLITLLCTAGTGRDTGEPQDPVTLTPRLYGLCERADIDNDPRLSKIEAEFFAAADTHEADAREEMALRALRQRKMELGPSFFAPRVLRAIVTYNSALLQRIDEEVLDSQDWGSAAPASEEPAASASVFEAPAASASVFEAPAASASVFEAPAILKLAEALRRREAGDAPDPCTLDRIAWSLDLAYPDESELAALLTESVGLREDVKGTMILVGLLCRSAIALDEDLAKIGILPQQIFGEWVRELDEALKQEISQRVADDDDRDARLLSELGSKFLYAPIAEAHGKNRGRGPARPTAPSRDDVGREAKKIAHEALESMRSKAAAGRRADWKAWPWARLARVGGAACSALLVLALAGTLLSDRDLERFGGDQLDRLSPYLSRGARSGEGQGPAFVGTIDEEWSALEVAPQMRVAANLVKALRAQGVREIMIFDDDRRLRIQALGAQPVRVLPPGNP